MTFLGGPTLVILASGATKALMGPVVSCNSLPNNKFLDWSKLKALASNKINVTEEFKFVSGRVENIMGKGENAGYQHFLLFL